MHAPVRQTSISAVLSLVFGILGWCVLPVIGSVVAIVCGHLARSSIRESRGALEGDGMAVAGLVLGYVMVALALLALVAIFLFFGGLLWFATTFGT